MKTNGNVLDVIPQFAEFVTAVIKALAKIWKKMDSTTAQGWIGNAKDLERVLSEALLLPGIDLADQLASWKKFYQEYFGLELDPSNLKIPEQQPGFDRLIVVAKSLTPNQVYDMCAKHFPCWRYVDDLDKAVSTNDRLATETYVIWVRDRAEADEENKGKSANTLASENHKGITLMERLVLELECFSETGKHLDVKNLTLCAGSRYAGGDVPSAYWHNGRFHVDYSRPSGAHFGSRARSVVS
ncbi:MAG: hypothetical protein WC610_01245 [Patescibacteria group bacterium]